MCECPASLAKGGAGGDDGAQQSGLMQPHVKMVRDGLERPPLVQHDLHGAEVDVGPRAAARRLCHAIKMSPPTREACARTETLSR